MGGFLVRVVIIGAIAFGAYMFRDNLTGNAGDLKVGDCFDEPAGETLITDVQHHPCEESHTSEVIFVGNMPGAKDAYPSDVEVDGFAESKCLPAYKKYTGADFDSTGEMTIGWFYPTTEGWKKGDRGMTCYAVREDGAALTTSIKN